MAKTNRTTCGCFVMPGPRKQEVQNDKRVTNLCPFRAGNGGAAMSLDATRRAWELELPMGQKIVLLVLADHANDDAVCWPSQRRIATRAGCTVRAVQIVLGKLEQRGLFRRVTADGRVSTYHLTLGSPSVPVRNGHAPPNDVHPPPESDSPPPPNQIRPNLLREPTKEPKEEADAPHPMARPPSEPGREVATTINQAGQVLPFAPRPDAGPLDARSLLFRDGLWLLRFMTGKPDDAARTMLGRLLKDTGDDAAVAYRIVTDAASLRPANPAAWIMAAGHSHRRPHSAVTLATDWGHDQLDSMASPEARAAVEATFA